VLLSESLQAGSKSSAQKSYAGGYENGQSDFAKRQYQALTERQRLAPQSDDAAHLRLFDVRFPSGNRTASSSRRARRIANGSSAPRPASSQSMPMACSNGFGAI